MSWPFSATVSKYQRREGTSSANCGARSVSRRDAPTEHRPGCFATHRKERLIAGDLKQTGKPDDVRISVEQEHELKPRLATAGL
jgi:hypothetical protein